MPGGVGGGKLRGASLSRFIGPPEFGPKSSVNGQYAGFSGVQKPGNEFSPKMAFLDTPPYDLSFVLMNALVF
jgi:hypothetical protein